MSTPKKSGKDLSALKARLAKKTGQAPLGGRPAASPLSPPSPPAAAQPPAPASPPVAAPPEPVATPPVDPPPPAAAELAAPDPLAAPEAPAAPRPEPPAPAAPPSTPAAPDLAPAGLAAGKAAAGGGEAPFGGGAAFDPDAGLIADAGVDVAPRKSTGLIALVAAASLCLGAAFGWLGRNISDTNARIDSAKRKGAEMAAEVGKVKDRRSRISLGIQDVEGKLAADPAKGAAALAELVTSNLKDFPRADALFGWQLASMHPQSIGSVFKLYEEANGLALDLPYLAQYVNLNAAALRQGMAGPRRFAVRVKEKEHQAVLVEHVADICNLEEKTPCEPGQAAKAVGHSIREAIGGAEVVLPKEEVIPLTPRGLVFKYAIGDKPETNAATQYSRLLTKVKARLEEMNKYEKRAEKALEQYAQSPTVNADTAQPDPGDG
ncbi:MAG: hypothetical protein B7733_26505 [Myxococcales bacterium FL481]|nr:MAG: hypothetical protein B7733_26505 [Myxococcales bacterium FL481]